jgi:hypothetical protein
MSAGTNYFSVMNVSALEQLYENDDRKCLECKPGDGLGTAELHLGPKYTFAFKVPICTPQYLCISPVDQGGRLGIG